MAEKHYRIAELAVSMEIQYPYTEKLCEDYEVQGAEFVPMFRIQAVQSEIEAEREGTEAGFSDGYLESLALYRKLCEKALEYDTFLFHGSAVAVDGKAYLFTAPSGTGKSTHTKLWKSYLGEAVTYINDDKPLIRVKEDAIYVYGTAWSGKHRLNSNTSAPIQGICLLKRGTENSIRLVTPMEAYPELYRQTYRPKEKEKMKKTLTLLNELAGRIPVYELHCNISTDAAKTAWEAMQPKNE